MVHLWGKTPIHPLFCFNGMEENAKLSLSMHKKKLQKAKPAKKKKKRIKADKCIEKQFFDQPNSTPSWNKRPD